MDAAKLNSKIIIQQKAAPFDANGEPDGTWSTFATVFACIKPTGGTERYINQQVVSEATHQIAIRYKSGITPKMRVLYGSRVFDIVQVHDREERHTEMWLVCKELVPGGIT